MALPPASPTATDWITAVTDVIQALAILVAGAWAYWKFVRGRTFRRRAELTIDSAELVGGAAAAIRAQATLRNTGGADIPIRVAVLRGSVADGDELDKGDVRWNRIVSVPLFSDHAWIESNETVHDDVLIPLSPAVTPVAPRGYRVTAIVVERRGKRWRWFGKVRPGAISWTAHSIVLPG
jgi:hypothetical protein